MTVHQELEMQAYQQDQELKRDIDAALSRLGLDGEVHDRILDEVASAPTWRLIEIYEAVTEVASDPVPCVHLTEEQLPQGATRLSAQAIADIVGDMPAEWELARDVTPRRCCAQLRERFEAARDVLV